MDGYLSKGSTEPLLVGFSVSIKLSPDNSFTFPTPVSPAQRRHTLSPFACVILKKKKTFRFYPHSRELHRVVGVREALGGETVEISPTSSRTYYAIVFISFCCLIRHHDQKQREGGVYFGLCNRRGVKNSHGVEYGSRRLEQEAGRSHLPQT